MKSINDFFDMETDANLLYDLQYEMEADNPNVKVPQIGEDYNYFEYPIVNNVDGSMHIVYCDMVDKSGKDSPTGSYRFRHIPEVTVAAAEHTGPNDTIDEGFARVFEWLKANGYESEGSGRISAIHGPWDRDDESEFVNECQVIIKNA